MAIGTVKARNRVFLAPMSGVTDVPFRRLAWRFGAGMVVSEMVASEAYVTRQAEMMLKAEGAGLPVHMVQLAGREAGPMALAARLAADSGADIIDINMGCPAKRVTNGYSGSALMRDPDHALRLIDAVVGAVDVPVTVKMRLGWDGNSINAPVIAARAQAAGVAAITVHGRTRCQFYKGRADWDAVAAVSSMVSVPVIVNGDIAGPADVGEALWRSGAAAVMVGRASYGAPWLCGAIAGSVAPPAGAALGDLITEHYESMLAYYGAEHGVRRARKHLAWALDRLELPHEAAMLRQAILTEDQPGRVTDALGVAFADAALKEAA